MKAYGGYLFDLDGTLVDTAPDINAALNHALLSHDFPEVEESLTRHWVGHGSRALVEQALLRLGRKEPDSSSRDSVTIDPARIDTQSLLDAFIGYYESHIADHSRPYPGVVRALAQLTSRGARLAVVTNKLTRLSEPLLSALDLDRHFAAIVCGDTTGKPKPAADPAFHACRTLGIEIADALFVGDSDTDVGCARAAGCDVVVVRDGYNHGVPAAELGADAVIETFADLV